MAKEATFLPAFLIFILSTSPIDGATHTMDNVLDFFPSSDGDGLNVIWAHGVNSITDLNQTLTDDTMMIETDIILRGIGTDNETDIPVHAHPPLTDSDLTLEHFLNVTTQYPDKGMKLDFKYLEALGPSMELVLAHEAELKAPLWLNADIVIGPNSPHDPISPQAFIDTANRYFNQTTMSLGFTTDWDSQMPDKLYTWTMIFDNLYYSYPLHPQPVTFPIRAVWCQTSWPKFIWLIGLRESFSITVWSSGTDDVDVGGLVDLRTYGGTRRIFFDLPDDQKAAFLEALGDPSRTPSPPVSTPWDSDQWVGFENDDGRNFAFFSSEGLGISGNASRAAIVHSNREHMPHEGDAGMQVNGLVQFVDRYDSASNTSVDIYIRSSSLLADSEERRAILAGDRDPSGVKFSIWSDGTVDVNGTHFFDKIPSAECYSFSITDKFDGKIIAAFVIKTCSDALKLDPNAESNMLFIFDKEFEDDQEYYVILTKSGGGKDLIIEGLTIEGSQVPINEGSIAPTTAKGSRVWGGGLGLWLIIMAGVVMKYVN